MSYKIKYPLLFTPIVLAGTVFRNRIFSSPMGCHPLTPDMLPLSAANAFFERKAEGGAASVCIGDCAVDSPRGSFHNNHMALDHPHISSYLTGLADSISRHGAVASIELSHAGMYSRDSAMRGNTIYGPVEMVSEHGTRVLPMTEEIIEETITAYVNAALKAKRSGFGMVTIHGGHGWLISQFVSPHINKRTDRWGGSVENRARLPIAIADAIRKAAGPNFPIEMRISGSECFDGGYDIDEGIAFSKQLDGHIDLLHVSAGNHEVAEVFTVTHPSMFLEDGVNVKYAAEIKKHIKTPVACVGSLSDPAMMEEIIASGKADVIEAARGLLADPDLPKKARAGKDDEIDHCMRCLDCFADLMVKGRYHCAINPVIGRESEAKTRTVPGVKKKVLIAGGGIAGMQAALTAAERGHEVILFEKSGSLGGVLKCEEKVSFKRHLHDYIAKRAHEVKNSTAELRLNTELTPELARELTPDVIIAAMGARPLVPSIKGIDGSNVLGAEEAYFMPENVGKKALIIGGGLVGTELGIHLKQLGHEVLILEMQPFIGSGGNILQVQAIGLEIKKLGIKLHLEAKALEISEKGVLAQTKNGEVFFEADSVIYAIGQKPLREEADALRFIAPEFHQIGDCLSPKNISEATSAAYNIVRGT